MAYDTDDFEQDVIDQSYNTPVLVDFWAEWCGPCQVLGPVLERIAEQNLDRWKLVKVDTEKHQQVAMQYNVSGIPNVKMFVDGQVVDEFTGALPEQSVLRWLDSSLPSENRQQVKEAAELLRQNKISEGQELLQSIVDAEPGNDEARVLLAQTKLYSDPAAAAELVKPIEPISDVYELAESTTVFSELFGYLEDDSALPDGDTRSAYLQAIRDLREKRYESALGGFIAIVQKDRYYNEDSARKACIAVFKSLGEEHEITQQYRSRFSRALHA